MPSERARQLLSLFDSWKQAKSPWLSHWEDLAWAMLPNAGGFATEYVDGQRRTDHIYDGAPQRAARGLANAIGGMLRPEGNRWFFLKSGDGEDSDDESSAWLADTEKRMMAAFDAPKARFRQATGEVDLGLVVLGTGVMFVGEGRRMNHLLFQSVALRDAAVMFDDEGNANGCGREKQYTLRQLVDMFGPDNVGSRAKELLKQTFTDAKKWDEKLWYVHIVLPRDDGNPNAVLAKNLPFSSVWIERDSADEVQVGGFHEFPFIVPRWDTTSGENYGRSPGMIALPDANTLQAMGETFLVAGQKSADPSLAVPDDGAVSAYNMYPGGLVYYSVESAKAVGGNPIFPIETGGQIPLTREMQMDIRDGVFAAFFRNILNLPVDGPDMTATEIMQRKEEFIREIGPVFGRLETDYTAPMVERAFRIMLRAGAFAPIPLSLAGRNVRFEYESPVKKVRQQIEYAAARVWTTDLLQLSQFKPGALDMLNEDEYARLGHEASALPEKLLNGKQKVEAQRRQRAQQQAQMAQAQMVAGAAEAAGKAAPMVKAMSEQRAA